MATQLSRLASFAPKGKPPLLAAVANGTAAMRSAGITTPRRFRHFLAQIAHESAGFSTLQENLNFTTPAAMRRAWPSRFKTDASTKPYLRNPQALANKVYGDRMGNRGSTTDDGWLYRGSGFMQTTGREGFLKRGKELGIDLAGNPDLLRNPDTAFKVACQEWKARNCNEPADRNDIEGVTRKINGGINGLADRRKWLAKAEKLFPDDLAVLPPGKEVAVPVPPEKPAAMPPAMLGVTFGHGADSRVLALQKRLDELGYHIVGQLDGIWGNKTVAAIAQFRDANSIRAPQLNSTMPWIDQATYDALSSPMAAQAPISPSRSQANTKDIIEDAPRTAVPVDQNAKLTTRTFFGSLIMTVLGFIGDAFSSASDALGQVKTFFSEMPWWVYAVLFTLIIGAFAFKAAQAKAGMKEDYKDGKIV